jgi:hypothetical protein
MTSSVVKAAAYRSGEKLATPEEQGKEAIHDYTRKSDVLFTEILTPDNAPEWVRHRETLWNRVEASEKRKDAQLAREVEVALPRELSLDECKELLRGFIGDQFTSKGMVADVAIHSHKATDGKEHPHAHILLTLRPLDGEGFGQKAREWNDKELLKTWRKEWELAANAALVRAGHKARLDHRSLKEQGLERAPQETRGKIGNKLYKAGHEQARASSEIAKERHVAETRTASRAAYSATLTMQQARTHSNYSPRGLQSTYAPRWDMDALLWQWLGKGMEYAVDWAFAEMRLPTHTPLYPFTRTPAAHHRNEIHPAYDEPHRTHEHQKEHYYDRDMER